MKVEYNTIDWSMDIKELDHNRQPLTCSRHDRLDDEQVYKRKDEDGTGYQCETCGWWRFDDLVGPE